MMRDKREAVQGSAAPPRRNDLLHPATATITPEATTKPATTTSGSESVLDPLLTAASNTTPQDSHLASGSSTLPIITDEATAMAPGRDPSLVPRMRPEIRDDFDDDGNGPFEYDSPSFLHKARLDTHSNRSPTAHWPHKAMRPTGPTSIIPGYLGPNRTNDHEDEEEVEHGEEDEDEPPNPRGSLAVQDTTTPHQQKYLSPASLAKERLLANPNIPDRTLKRPSVLHDPDNLTIMRLRVEESLPWASIATHLNNARVRQGGNPTWTTAAVYGRFVRNAPRIASANGAYLDPKDYVHLKGERKRKRSEGERPLPRLSEAAAGLLVEAYEEARNGFWVTVAENMRRRSGREFTDEECARLWETL